MNEHNPRIKIGFSGVFLPEVIYHSLGRPDRIVIAVDEVHKAFQIQQSDFGYKPKIRAHVDGAKVYQFLNASRPKRKISYYIGNLPLGLYRPLGGGIFEYDIDQPPTVRDNN
jgi:hypothetical protein